MELLLTSLGRVPLTISAHWFPFVIALGIMMSMAGLLARGMGLHNIFHEDPELANHAKTHGMRVYLGSPTFLTQIWLTVFLALAWGFAYTLGIVAEGNAAMDRLSPRFEELGPGGLGEAGLSHGMGSTVGPQVLLSAILSLGFACLRIAPGVPPLQKGEALRAFAGFVVGVFVAWGLIKAAIEISPGVNAILDSFRLSGGNTFSLAIPSAILMIAVLSLRRMNSAIALISLFTLILIFYACISAIPDVLQPWVLMAFGFLIVATNALFMGRGKASSRLKFEIPNIRTETGRNYYDPANQVDLDAYYKGAAAVARGGAGISQSEGEDGAGAARAAPPAQGALDPIAVLERWRDNWRTATGEEKPRLTLLACSGGAYRAGFWTALVLDELSEMERRGELPGFCRSLRLITGASGGMVGASYFAAMARDGEPTPPVVPQIERDILAVQSLGGIRLESGEIYDPAPNYPYKRAFPIPRDSLSPIAQQLVQRDLPGLFSRATQPVDRGTVLEDQWPTLDRSFEEMRAGEAAGWRPSLLFSPMLAETGQPLLISNLDVGKVRTDPDGVETADLFKWFPGARSHFRVKTAVRLNASFPYISPSAALPTAPYRRVVDAGYYDNYGVDLAVSFLSEPRIRRWIIENCAGVLLVQTRAFPFVNPSVEPPASVQRAFQWLTTPLDAAGAARAATMTFRNRQSLRQVQRIYDFLTATENFLSTVRFEVESFTSLSWYMTERELDDLRGDCPEHHKGHTNAEEGRGLKSPGNVEAFEAVRAFWKRPAPATGDAPSA